MLGTELAQHLGQQRQQLAIVHADELAPHPGRVGDRPENVEHRAHADLPARADGVFHGAVQLRGKQEGDADFIQATAHLLRLQVDGHAQRRQHIGAAAATGDRAVAMLGHRHPGPGDHKRRYRGNIETALAIAAGAAQVHGVAVACRHRCGLGAHAGGKPGDLIRGLALHAQSRQQRADLRRRRLAFHDGVHGGAGLLLGQIFATQNRLDRLSYHRVNLHLF